MFRILHTADWHLGQSFHGFDRDREHAVFLDWLIGIVEERHVDALIIAGDIFDSINPSSGAQRRFFDFLARIHAAAPALQVVIIAGNHDAPARLEAPTGLFERLNIKALGTVPRDLDGEVNYQKFLIPLKDAHANVKAIAIAVPFLRPADVPVVPEACDSYLAGIREFYRRATQAAVCLRENRYRGAVLIALGHCHLTDAVESRESERRIVIGGEEALPPSTFGAELAYVALGHLHKPQEMENGRICYSGSPIPLSFSERDFIHRVVEVTLDQSGFVSLASLPVPHGTMLVRIPADGAAPMAEVLTLIRQAAFDPDAPRDAHPFLEIRVLDDGPDPSRRRTIEQALEGKPVRLASIKLESPQRTAALSGADDGLTSTLAGLASLDPEEIMRAAYFERYQSEPDNSLLAVLREVLASEVANAK
jgi:DNA repair protein SbcD/Mre11